MAVTGVFAVLVIFAFVMVIVSDRFGGVVVICVDGRSFLFGRPFAASGKREHGWHGGQEQSLLHQ